MKCTCPDGKCRCDGCDGQCENCCIDGSSAPKAPYNPIDGARTHRERMDRHYAIRKRQELVAQAIAAVDRNKETFIAQWIIQHPDEDIGDYAMMHQNDWSADGHHAVKFWIEKKV